MADEIHRQGGRQRFLQGLSHSERLDAALSGNKRLHYRNASEPSGSLWRREVFSSRLENRRLGDFNSTRTRRLCGKGNRRSEPRSEERRVGKEWRERRSAK